MCVYHQLARVTVGAADDSNLHNNTHELRKYIFYKTKFIF